MKKSKKNKKMTQVELMKKVRKPPVPRTKVIKEKNDKGYDRKDTSWMEEE